MDADLLIPLDRGDAPTREEAEAAADAVLREAGVSLAEEGA